MYPLGKKTGKYQLAPYFLVLPALIVFCVTQFFPSIATVLISFTDMPRMAYQSTEFIGLANYYEFFRPEQFKYIWITIKNTFNFTVTVTIIQNGLGLMIAIVLNKKWFGRTFFRGLVFLPVLLGVTVSALIWKLGFYQFGGVVQKIMVWLTGEESRFFWGPNAFPYIMFVQIWTYVGYSTLIFLAGLQVIPEELYEAAKIDGAGRVRQFFHVTLPLLSQAITVNVLLSIIGAMKTYDVILVTSGGRFNTRTLGYFMYEQAFSSSISGADGGRLGYAGAVATILFLFVFIVVLFAQNYLRKREVEL
jgi:raffinose/stachyose/melibiose transport system permease protein